MKVLLVLILGLVSVVNANAGSVCGAVKRGEGSSIERGVKVKTSPGSLEEYVWFGGDLNLRDRAYAKCDAILKASRCISIAPKASDRYQNVGDPGFGPRLYVEKSSEAGILEISYPGFEGANGEYYAFFTGCEEARGELALKAVEDIQYEARKQKCISDGYPEWACPGLFY